MDKNNLQPHPSWDIVDSSKLQTYQQCAREHFFNYVLGWTLEGPNINLVFGKAWHICMAHILENGYTIEAIQQAAVLGEEYFRRFFPLTEDAINEPKVPGIFPIALAEYVARYKSDNFEVLFTEVGGIVPIDEKRFLHLRIDAVIRDHDRHNKIVSPEHKTSKRRGYFGKYTKDIQSGTYNHALFCSFPSEEVYGVEINGAVFLKRERDFQRLPARRTPQGMLEWLWTVQHWYDRLEWDFAELNECSEDDDVMMAFARNTESCTKYGQCKYYDICHARTNPLQFPEAPPGYEVEWWDPREEETKATIGPDGKIVSVKKEENENQVVEAPITSSSNLSPLERARAKMTKV